jgi:hypothetical protein
VLWSLIVYQTLQGSAWLSQIDGISENPTLRFNPFAASVETLKRVLARNESRDNLNSREAIEAAAASRDNASLALMRIFTNGVADDRIEKATRLLANDKLTVNEKLTKMDALIPFPPTASAQNLAEMFGVKKQAVLKTDWWIQNRKGEKQREVGRRREGHRKRAKSYEAADQEDDGK